MSFTMTPIGGWANNDDMSEAIFEQLIVHRLAYGLLKAKNSNSESLSEMAQQLLTEEALGYKGIVHSNNHLFKGAKLGFKAELILRDVFQRVRIIDGVLESAGCTGEDREAVYLEMIMKGLLTQEEFSDHVK